MTTKADIVKELYPEDLYGYAEKSDKGRKIKRYVKPMTFLYTHTGM